MSERTQLLATVGLRVLILDSDDEARGVMAYFFTRAGHQVFQAKGPSEAWQILTAGTMDCLVASTTTLLGPGKSFLAAIQAECPNLSITAIATTRSLTLRKRLKASRVSYLEKPLSIEALTDSLGWPGLKNPEDNRAIPR